MTGNAFRVCRKTNVPQACVSGREGGKPCWYLPVCEDGYLKVQAIIKSPYQTLLEEVREQWERTNNAYWFIGAYSVDATTPRGIWIQTLAKAHCFWTDVLDGLEMFF